MTHREFLTWLQPRLEKASATGLPAEGVSEILEVLARMRDAGALQPFASRLHHLLHEHPTLDAATVAELAREVRLELVPPREQTIAFTLPGNGED